jgi:hypothetical protein
VVLSAETSLELVGEWMKEMRIYSRDLLYAIKSYDMGSPALLPIQGRYAEDFYCP